jgi:hypothetical protein
MESESRFKTCFISAPFGVDTSVLRRSLSNLGVRWFDQTSFTPDLEWPDAVDKAVATADFVCVVLPDGTQGNIFFELGIAYAKRKPILAFIGKSAILPTDVRSLTYFRVELRDVEAVGYALETFLTHARDEHASEISMPRSRRESKHSVDAFISVPETVQGLQFEDRTAELLRDAGFIVSRRGMERAHDQGADLAVWIEELQNYALGNPLLVEVKAGNLTQESIHRAELQLRSYVQKTHGRSGLLIYWDWQNREFPPVEKGWPVIFRLSGEALTRLVREQRLPDELIRLRNTVAHGEV